MSLLKLVPNLKLFFLFILTVICAAGADVEEEYQDEENISRNHLSGKDLRVVVAHVRFSFIYFFS